MQQRRVEYLSPRGIATLRSTLQKLGESSKAIEMTVKAICAPGSKLLDDLIKADGCPPNLLVERSKYADTGLFRLPPSLYEDEPEILRNYLLHDVASSLGSAEQRKPIRRAIIVSSLVRRSLLWLTNACRTTGGQT